MIEIKWSPEISVNDPSIDYQHKTLIEITNRLMASLAKGKGSRIINETISELLRYSNKHFSDEEAFLLKHGYPELEEHKKLHRQFTRRIAEFSIKMTTDPSSIDNEISLFLIDWIEDHLCYEDQQYKRFVSSINE